MKSMAPAVKQRSVFNGDSQKTAKAEQAVAETAVKSPVVEQAPPP